MSNTLDGNVVLEGGAMRVSAQTVTDTRVVMIGSNKAGTNALFDSIQIEKLS